MQNLSSSRPSLGDSKRMSSRRIVDFDSEQLLSMEEIRDNVRLTASKLLNDLDSSDEEEEDGEDYDHEQLPHAEDARLYAGRLLEKNKSSRLQKQQSMRKPINILRSLRAMKDMREISDSAFSSDVDAMSMEMDMHDMPQKRKLPRHKLYCMLGSLVLLAIAATIVTFFSKENSDVDSYGSPSSSPPDLSQDTSESPRVDAIIDLLIEKGVSDSATLTTDGTPQRQAVDWIANTDVLQYDPKDDESRIIQRYVITVLYYALNGPKWKHQVNFLSPEEVCSWYRDIPAHKVDDVYSVGVTCNGYLQVETILLRKYHNMLQYACSSFLLTTVSLSPQSWKQSRRKPAIRVGCLDSTQLSGTETQQDKRSSSRLVSSSIKLGVV